jgi:hypothetical protein
MVRCAFVLTLSLDSVGSPHAPGELMLKKRPSHRSRSGPALAQQIPPPATDPQMPTPLEIYCAAAAAATAEYRRGLAELEARAPAVSDPDSARRSVNQAFQDAMSVALSAYFKARD